MSGPTNIYAPTIETRDGMKHRLGAGSGLVGYRGLSAKRAARAAAAELIASVDDAETGPNGLVGSEDSAEDAEDDSSPEVPPVDDGYDPNAHTVTEVTAYLDEYPDQANFVLDRERAGKARVTLIGA